MLNVQIPSCIGECRNVYCQDKEHIAAIDLHLYTVLGNIDNSVKNYLPQQTSRNKNKRFPGWNDEVKPLCEQAMFWHSIWISAGKLLNNTLHNLMKKTRNRYHFQIRKCRKAADMLKRDKLSNACITSEGDIFHELKKLHKIKDMVSITIDGTKDNITGPFANVYERIYNSIDDEEEMAKIYLRVNKSLDSTSLEDVNLITTDKIREATSNLKSNRNDPLFMFSSDCLKNAPLSVFEHLTYLIKSFLIHSHISNDLL